MGETVTYLGHVDIVPGLSQEEYDYPASMNRRPS